jgi:hypothetical protein
LYRDTWDIAKEKVDKEGNAVKNRTMSVPVLTFIDAFGLYRNSNRSLIGIYDIIASLTIQERNRRQNVLALTLGPHGSNLDNVILALQSLIPLDKGIPIDINGEKTTVYVFTMAFIGDMVRTLSSLILRAY